MKKIWENHSRCSRKHFDGVCFVRMAVLLRETSTGLLMIVRVKKLFAVISE